MSASTSTGQFKPLQSTNYVLSADFGQTPEEIKRKKARIAEHWKETKTKMVLVYHHSDLFQGYGETGREGDASLMENYDFRQLDTEIGRVVRAGAVACLQFEDCLNRYLDYANPGLFEKIGYVLADRYGNGRGFFSKNALALVELYPEPDMYTRQLHPDFFIPYFERIAAFARGTQAANPFVGVGACGTNRMYYNPETMPESPYHYKFYKYIKEHDVPIKAVTFHWVTPFSQNPYDLVASTNSVRDQMNRAGLKIPIWITEYNRNPAPILPSETQAFAEYKSISQAASFMLSALMIAQDADVEQCLPWVGLGYGLYGGGNAYFEAYYDPPENEHSPDKINALGAAWYLHGKFLEETPFRINIDGVDNCFGGLAGMSESRDVVQILLSNYQYSDQLLRELNRNYFGAIDETCKKWTGLGSDGCLTGEYFTFKSPPAPPGLSISGPRPQFCTNKTTSYDIHIEALPWDMSREYECTILRANDEHCLKELKKWSGSGKSVRLEQDFPASSMDLVIIKARSSEARNECEKAIKSCLSSDPSE